MNNSLDAGNALLATHERLRQSGFPLVSVICAHTRLDAKVWLARWTAERGCGFLVPPDVAIDMVIAAYKARVPNFHSRDADDPANASLPIIAMPGELKSALPAAVALIARFPSLPIAVTTGIADIVDHLLDATVPIRLVVPALQGLVPIAETEHQVLKKIAEGRQVTPFLRGACEGLVFYMLEARSETRGLFSANRRVVAPQSGRSYEVDILCAEAKLIIEIDGLEHNNTRQRMSDEKKQRELESLGYRVRRFTNNQIAEDPVGVWRLIGEQLAMRQSIRSTDDNARNTST